MKPHTARTCSHLIAPLLSFLGAVSAARAQPFAIDWYSIDAGAGASTGDPFMLEGMIGQWDAGAAMSGGEFLLEGGFEPGYLAGVPCPADFNGDTHVDSQDFFDFLTAFFAQSPGADFNDDGATNSQDFFDFLAAFFEGCP